VGTANNSIIDGVIGAFEPGVTLSRNVVKERILLSFPRQA
jgi:hypothetical protein